VSTARSTWLAVPELTCLLMVWHRAHIADVAKAVWVLGCDRTAKQFNSSPHSDRCAWAVLQSLVKTAKMLLLSSATAKTVQPKAGGCS